MNPCTGRVRELTVNDDCRTFAEIPAFFAIAKITEMINAISRKGELPGI